MVCRKTECLETTAQLKYYRATISDIHHYLIPLLRKNPSNIILHTGTNDTGASTSRDILNDIISLKNSLNETLPECKVFISTPTIRVDNGKAMLTVTKTTNHLLQLHMNLSGIIKLAKIFMIVIKTFWVQKRYLGISITDDTHMTSMKIIQFLRSLNPLVHLRRKFFHPLDLGRPIPN